MRDLSQINAPQTIVFLPLQQAVSYGYVAVNPAGLAPSTIYAYVLNIIETGPSFKTNVQQCSIANNGQLTNCQLVNSVAPGPFSTHVRAQQIFFQLQDASVHRYTPGMNNIYLDDNDSGATGFAQVSGIALLTVHGTSYVYVTDYQSNTVWQCKMDPNSGALNCLARY